MLCDKIQDRMICAEYPSTVRLESILTKSCEAQMLAARLFSFSTTLTMAIMRMFKTVAEVCHGANKSPIRHLQMSPTIEVLKSIASTRWVHL